MKDRILLSTLQKKYNGILQSPVNRLENLNKMDELLESTTCENNSRVNKISEQTCFFKKTD